jgi:hypothetical protein
MQRQYVDHEDGEVEEESGVVAEVLDLVCGGS